MGYAEHFSLANIPYGIASGGRRAEPAPATRVEDTVFFLADLDLQIDPEIKQTFSQVWCSPYPHLNPPAHTTDKIPSQPSTPSRLSQSPDCENCAQASRAL